MGDLRSAIDVPYVSFHTYCVADGSAVGQHVVSLQNKKIEKKLKEDGKLMHTYIYLAEVRSRTGGQNGVLTSISFGYKYLQKIRGIYGEGI